VHGKSGRVEEFAGRLIGLKGVQHGRFVMSASQPQFGHYHTKREAAHVSSLVTSSNSGIASKVIPFQLEDHLTFGP
jgi:hypothetical protein